MDRANIERQRNELEETFGGRSKRYGSSSAREPLGGYGLVPPAMPTPSGPGSSGSQTLQKA